MVSEAWDLRPRDRAQRRNRSPDPRESSALHGDSSVRAKSHDRSRLRNQTRSPCRACREAHVGQRSARAISRNEIDGSRGVPDGPDATPRELTSSTDPCMNERRRPHRRGRGPRPFGRPPAEPAGEPNPYRDTSPQVSTPDGDGGPTTSTPPAPQSQGDDQGGGTAGGATQPYQRQQGGGGQPQFNGNSNGRRNNRRNRGRGGGGPRREQQPAVVVPVVADGETAGWFDAA